MWNEDDQYYEEEALENGFFHCLCGEVLKWKENNEEVICDVCESRHGVRYSKIIKQKEKESNR